MATRSFVLVCGGTGCESAKSDAIYRGLLLECEERGIKAEVEIVKTGCFGFCEKGPIVKILPDETFYVDVQARGRQGDRGRARDQGPPGEAPALRPGRQEAGQASTEIDFYQKQFRIVLRNCGVIDPEKIEEYIARDGYAALEKVLFEMTPDQVIDELQASRACAGRGGAGFPTWLKWKFSKDAASDEKYVVCNADEGDPGAYMDRSARSRAIRTRSSRR